jgi:lipopolysaccharide cholinephosphotransferase
MKKDNELLNHVAKKNSLLVELNANDARRLKQSILILYEVIAKFCEENGLIIFLGGGSCLGAVRHKGFIPWDDDIDLNMPRNDYDRLIDLIERGKFPSGYEFTYPCKDKDTKNLFLKIYIKDTIYSEIFDVGTRLPRGIFIDIFPMENVPDNNYIRKIKGIFAELLVYLCTSSFYYESRNRVLNGYMGSDKNLERRYRFRCFLGFLCNFIGHRKLSYWTDCFVQRRKEGKDVTYPSGRKHYMGEILPRNVFLPTSRGIFEGLEVNLPHDTNAYLTNLYGSDYMEIPPIEKRERHFVVSLKFNDKI